jgi:cobalamin biosynthesis protein CobT
MAKDKKTTKATKATKASEPKVDARLYTLVGSFLKDAGLSSTVKIFEAETSSRKVEKSSKLPAPKSLEEALVAWEKTAEKPTAEDSGEESDSESSDSDSSDSDSDDDTDSTATLAEEKKEEKVERKDDKKTEKKAEKKEDSSDVRFVKTSSRICMGAS